MQFYDTRNSGFSLFSVICLVNLVQDAALECINGQGLGKWETKQHL